uniref:Uncharacterized protein n=1 Tax=Naja naja TaxID=35670 RepID=A0A8C6XTE8_NAJNA
MMHFLILPTSVLEQSDLLFLSLSLSPCLKIWDTAGTERFHALGTALYRGSDCCLLVFDVTSVYSFQALEKWHKQLLLQIEPEEEPTFPVAIIGNKTDLENREQVSSEEAEMWSRLHDATYFE